MRSGHYRQVGKQELVDFGAVFPLVEGQGVLTGFQVEGTRLGVGRLLDDGVVFHFVEVLGFGQRI